MHYKELFEAANWFRRDTFAYNSAYTLYQNSADWKNIHNFSNDEITTMVLGFLNAWRCRIKVTDQVIRGIREAFASVLPLIQALEGEVLEDIDFQKQVNIENSYRNISECVSLIMDRMINVGHHFRHVAASKLLHMVNPALFMMWDNFIIANYSLSPNAHSYTYRFMPLMQEEANEAIKTYMKDFDFTRTRAIKTMKEKCSGKSLAKLVDEYNYWKFSRGERT